ncbi:hypothetical protein ACVXHB_13525 [Escherichia coli]
MQRLIKEYGNESIYRNDGTGTLGGTMTRSCREIPCRRG